MKRLWSLASAIALCAAAGCCGSHCGYGCGYPGGGSYGSGGNCCPPQCCSYNPGVTGDTAYYNQGTPTIAAAPGNSGIRLKPKTTTR